MNRFFLLVYRRTNLILHLFIRYYYANKYNISKNKPNLCVIDPILLVSITKFLY